MDQVVGRMNDTAHNKPNALAIDLPDVAGGYESSGTPAA